MAPDAPAARAIADAAAAGDARAAAAIELYARRLAKALAGVINVLDPDVVVLGGGLSNVESLYRARARVVERMGLLGSRGYAARARAARRLERRPRRGLAVAGL